MTKASKNMCYLLFKIQVKVELQDNKDWEGVKYELLSNWFIFSLCCKYEWAESE